MPKFKVTSPDGKAFVITADTQEQAASEADAYFGVMAKPPMTAEETAKDALIGTGSGVAGGALDMAGLPANVASLSRAGAAKLGVGEDTLNTVSNSIKNIPGIGGLLNASKAYNNWRETGTDDFNKYLNYDPKGQAGKYGKRIGGFAPAVIGGPGGMGARALKYMVAPGVASEAANQATEGTSAQPIVTALAGLTGMGLGAAATNVASEARAASKLAKAATFDNKATEAYEIAEAAGVRVAPSYVKQVRKSLVPALKQEGYVPGRDTAARATIKSILADVKAKQFGNQPMSLAEFDAIRQKFGSAIGKVSTRNDRDILVQAKQHWEDAVQGLNSSNTTAGNTAEALAALNKAKASYKTGRKLSLLDDMEQRAYDTGKARYSQGGVELGTRREFLNFIRKPNGKRQALDPAEFNAFQKVAHGTNVGNTSRFVGKIAASPYGLMGGGGAGFLAAGPAGALVLPALGGLARIISKRSTQRAVNNARALIATGKKLKRPYKSKFGTTAVGANILNRYYGDGQ